MNTEVSQTSSCVPGYHICKDIGLQLFMKNFDVKEDLIQTEVIDMQSPLSVIITGYLPCKYHKPVSNPIRTGSEVTWRFITSGSRDDSMH